MSDGSTSRTRETPGLEPGQTRQEQIELMKQMEMEYTSTIFGYYGSIGRLRSRIYDGKYVIPGRTQAESMDMVDEAYQDRIKSCQMQMRWAQEERNHQLNLLLLRVFSVVLVTVLIVCMPELMDWVFGA